MTLQGLYDTIGADYQEAITRIGSEKFISKYVGKFLNEPSYTALKKAREEGADEEALFRAAHTLKGVCLNLAFTNMLPYAEAITENYRPGGTKKCDNVQEAFEQLDIQYNNTIVNIEKYVEELG